MRAVPLIAGVLLAASGAAQAADLPPEDDIGLHYPAIGRGVAPLIVTDYEPGVVVRAYWIPPWRNRHYFPTSGEPPAIGRDEDLSAAGSPPEPAETFSREWTNARVIERVHYDDVTPTRRANVQMDEPRAPDKGGVQRVIRAEAEVTILGPDRMSIRLFRKGDGRRAKAEAAE